MVGHSIGLDQFITLTYSILDLEFQTAESPTDSLKVGDARIFFQEASKGVQGKIFSIRDINLDLLSLPDPEGFE
jgi:hypothetical protein